MQRVLVLDNNRQPLMPCHPARARKLLRQGRARVFRRYPFTIILIDREGGDVQPVTLKIDPGSKTTGIALVANFQRGQRVVWAAHLTHRGQPIRDALLSRLMCRPDKYGFPRTKAKAGRVQYGFQTGDIVRAVVTSGKKIGTYVGRVAVRSSGRFDITTRKEKVQGISYRYCTLLHKSDGYSYEKGEAASSTY